MELIKLHIENFGKLSNFDYEFSNGLNVIKQENGYGKTSFADFIKAMFYGMEDKRTTKVLLDRKKYMPWQGGAYGGFIDFKINNRQYRIERFFSNKEAEDSFCLYDLTTNLQSYDYSKNIGEEIFKLNKEAFERSIFITGENVETSMNDSINAKLGNILESENDINTSEKAIKILDDAIKFYKKTGNRGEINDTISKKIELEKKLEQNRIDEKILNERKREINEINIKSREIKKEQNTYKQLLSDLIHEETRMAKSQQYSMILKNYQEANNKLLAFKAHYDEEDELQDKISSNQSKIDSIKLKIEEKEKIIMKNKKINTFIITILIVIFISLIITLVTKNRFLIINIISFILLSIIYISRIFFIINLKNTYQNYKKEKENYQNLSQTLFIMRDKQLNDRNIELEKLKIEYDEKLKLKNQFETENNVSELKNIYCNSLNVNKDEIENKIKKLDYSINTLLDEKSYKQNQIYILENNLDATYEIENDLQELCFEIDDMKNNYDILIKTKSYLERAKEQFSSHYMGLMKKNFLENINILNIDNINIDIDINLKPQLNAYGSSKDIRFLSTGYKDLVYICMRMSLIKALFEEETPFIVLDDPFVNLDENKIHNASNLLKGISNKYQIIYFTCHKSRVL